jgi:hypothetical protein
MMDKAAGVVPAVRAYSECRAPEKRSDAHEESMSEVILGRFAVVADLFLERAGA